MVDLDLIDDWCCLDYGVAYNGKGQYETALEFISQISDTSLQGYEMKKAFSLSRVGKENEALRSKIL